MLLIRAPVCFDFCIDGAMEFVRLNVIMTVYSASLFMAAVFLKEASCLLQIPTSMSMGMRPHECLQFCLRSVSSEAGMFADPAVIRLALVYSLQLLGLSSFTAITFINTESGLTSVERIFQFLGIPQEKARIKPETDPSRKSSWAPRCDEDGVT